MQILIAKLEMYAIYLRINATNVIKILTVQAKQEKNYVSHWEFLICRFQS